MVVGSIATQFSSTAGFIAAAIAIGGFLAHARPAIAGKRDTELRRATAIGGLVGLALALLVTVAAVVTQ
jgi:hypothetical protein